MLIKDIQFAQSVHLTHASFTFARIGENGVHNITYIPNEQKYVIKATIYASGADKHFETWVHASNVKYAKPEIEAKTKKEPLIPKTESFEIPASTVSGNDIPDYVPEHLQSLAKDANEPAPSKARRGRAPKTKQD